MENMAVIFYVRARAFRKDTRGKGMERKEKTWEKEMKSCTLCPRNCKVDRLSGSAGFCRVSAALKAARAALHFWEEPCISGTRGSGAVFFCGCSMGCVFCQNELISRGKTGKEITTAHLAEIFLKLQNEKKAHNINLVTPTHYVPQIAEALEKAREQGLVIPVVYNSSAYEKPETLKRMEGLVDIYLPDFKYMDGALARKYSQAEDYSFWAKQALEEMVRQVPEPEFTPDGMMKKGVIVRHLILPGCRKDSKEVLRYLKETYGDQIYISLMNQYTPMPGISRYPELNRTITKREYEWMTEYALSIGIENGFIQEGNTAQESFIPPFDAEGLE